MLRDIANRVAGRRKSTDESLSVSEATELLGSLNGSTNGNIKWGGGEYKEFAIRGIAPKDMVDFVEKGFSTKYGGYSNIRHQVYTGESGDKHYIEMAHGNIEGRFGSREIKGRPFRRATIDFLVQEE